ncbi:MAG: phosphate uptake regulator PhoU [Thaumarchaeota archaeon]|nr:phosphate uptake regulator PhoU [Nitrososphaerota archaeon]MCL5319126.1 phosphate uptake regulator PhoU [Nitrososphaerota archaeon]
MKVETRKVQQVGHSTLMVSLPKDWVTATGLSQGDILTLQQDDDGSLHILPVGVSEKREIVKSIVDADKCEGHSLLTRIITGIYILGYETLEITSKKGFESDQLAEIRQSIQRLTGMSIVEQGMNHVVIKNFVDPTRFPTNGLLRRIYIITSWMQEASIQALKERRKSLANEVLHMENEVDRIYWLVVRQMLLAVKDKHVAKMIGIESPLNIVGDRTIAKVLEKIGDLSENVASEVLTILDSDYTLEKHVLDELDNVYKLVHDVYDTATKAFFAVDIHRSNETLEKVENVKAAQKQVIDTILSGFRSSLEKRGGPVIYESVDAYVALRAMLWSFSQIVEYCGTIAEITLNRALERPGDLCHFERLPSAE